MASEPIQCSAQIEWCRSDDEAFTDNRYSRGHQWQFDGGLNVPASSSAHIVPLPYSVAEHVDPEEAFIAALSSCHMLFFLSFAARDGWCVDWYRDNAIGTMGRNAEGREAMTEVRLRPCAEFAGVAPSREQLEALHHRSHEACFIANSVTTKVVTDIVEPVAD